METLIIFISKSALVLSLFFLAYHLLLKRDTSFHLNRLFLLAGILTSFSLPAVEFTRKIIVEASLLTNNRERYSFEESLSATEPVTEVNWWFIIGMLYLTGVAFFVLRLLLQVVSLGFFLRKADRSTEDGYTFYNTDKEVPPFSFFKIIVYNPALHAPQELILILRHEKAHARQWHSLDVLLSNLCLCVLWFNPLTWFYKKSLLQNLEYLADRETVAVSGSVKEYQKTLVRATVTGLSPVLGNHFYQSLIKKRIIMLNKQATSKNAFWKAGLVLPFLVVFVLGFQVRTEAQVVAITPQTNQPNSNEEEFSITIDPKATQENLEKVSQLFTKRGIELRFETVERNAEGTITTLQASFHNTADGRSGNYNQNNSDGIRPFKFYAKENGETGFQTIRESPETSAASFRKDPELITGKDFLIVLEDKVYQMNMLYGKYIELSEEPEILDPQEAQKRFGKTSKDGALVISQGKLINDFDAAMHRVDAHEAGTDEDYLHISKELGAVLVNINKEAKKSKPEADDMFNNSVFNNTDSDSLDFIEKYRKSKFFSGVHRPAVEFENSNAGYRSALDNQKQEPLIVVDGEVQPRNSDPAQLNPENIKNITVLKNENATEKYGEKGKNGVIEIILKKEGDIPAEQRHERSPEKAFTYTGEKITIKTKADTLSTNEGAKSSSITISGVSDASFKQEDSLLYVLDGEILDKDFDLSAVEPDNIASIVVLKGDLAVEKYGKKAAEGVIEITTKK